jgi:hypothetical protein
MLALRCINSSVSIYLNHILGQMNPISTFTNLHPNKKAYEFRFYELQSRPSSDSIIYLCSDDGLVIEAETCCHIK